MALHPFPHLPLGTIRLHTSKSSSYTPASGTGQYPSWIKPLILFLLCIFHKLIVIYSLCDFIVTFIKIMVYNCILCCILFSFTVMSAVIISFFLNIMYNKLCVTYSESVARALRSWLSNTRCNMLKDCCAKHLFTGRTHIHAHLHYCQADPEQMGFTSSAVWTSFPQQQKTRSRKCQPFSKILFTFILHIFFKCQLLTIQHFNNILVSLLQ